jgi:hypothetical protein
LPLDGRQNSVLVFWGSTPRATMSFCYDIVGLLIVRLFCWN